MFERELRDLSFVPRWSLIRTITPQNVAEHLFYSTIYASYIARIINRNLPDDASLVDVYAAGFYASMHDVEETITSDIPGPVKRSAIDRQKFNAVVESEMSRRFPRVLTSLAYLQGMDPRYAQITKVASLMDDVFYLATERQMGNGAIEKVYTSNKNALENEWNNLPANRLYLIREWTTIIKPAILGHENGQSVFIGDEGL